MTATATKIHEDQDCPAWCIHNEEAEADGIHFGELHEVGDLAVSLTKHFGETDPCIWMNDDFDNEFGLSATEAENLGFLLLTLAAQLRLAAQLTTAGPTATAGCRAA